MVKLEFPFPVGKANEETPSTYASDVGINELKGVEADNVQEALEDILARLKSGSGTITVDSALDKSSTNPVQNQVLAKSLIFT